MFYKNKLAFLINVYVFFSAFILFLLELTIGKYFLPYFGSSASVWNLCMAFFTTMLLVAYLYAYWITRLKREHIIYTHLSLGLLCIFIGLFGYTYFSWPSLFLISIKDVPILNPEYLLISLLFIGSSLPFIFLGATNIIFQDLYYKAYGKDPYYIYIISNFGSFVGLISLPLAFEFLFPIHIIAHIVATLFLLIVFILITFLFLVKKGSNFQKSEAEKSLSLNFLKYKNATKWISVSFIANALLISVTNYISQEVAPFPMVWALILSVYLLSYITGFQSISNAKLRIISYASILSLLTSLIMREVGPAYLIVFFVIYLFLMFTLLNNKLYIDKPEPKYLSSFYLSIALGGALGSLFTSFVPVIIFKDFYEITIFSVIAIFFIYKHLFLAVDFKHIRLSSVLRIATNYSIIIVILLTTYLFPNPIRKYWSSDKILFSDRNFYGLTRVLSNEKYKYIINGNTIHGIQEKDSQPQANSYYWENTGAGKTITYLQSKKDSLNIAVIGLGAGELGGYCRNSDKFTFYEINPAVTEVAKTQFDFIEYCKNNEIFEGDGRIILEQQSREKSREKYDLILVDAFTGDTVPTHLITVEALALYKSLIKEDGAIAFNISNKYLDLAPLLNGIAEANLMNNLTSTNTKNNYSEIKLSATWSIVTNNDDLLNNLRDYYSSEELGTIINTEKKVVWSDKHNNLLTVPWKLKLII